MLNEISFNENFPSLYSFLYSTLRSDLHVSLCHKSKIMSVFSGYESSYDYLVCERFYLLAYNDCIGNCESDGTCFRECGRTYAEDLENCPCKKNCPQACPCPDYDCPARILVLNTYSYSS